MTNTIRALVEVNERCWRGDECELCAGVRQGVGRVAMHCQRHADLLDHRVRTSPAVTLSSADVALVANTPILDTRSIEGRANIHSCPSFPRGLTSFYRLSVIYTLLCATFSSAMTDYQRIRSKSCGSELKQTPSSLRESRPRRRRAGRMRRTR